MPISSQIDRTCTAGIAGRSWHSRHSMDVRHCHETLQQVQSRKQRAGSSSGHVGWLGGMRMHMCCCCCCSSACCCFCLPVAPPTAAAAACHLASLLALLPAPAPAAHLVQVAVHFRTCLVQSVHCGAAQLKLAAWLQRHALPVLQQPNDVPVLDDWLPAEALLDAPQQRRNLLMGGPLRVGHPVAELLMLCAYPAAAVRRRLQHRRRARDVDGGGRQAGLDWLSCERMLAWGASRGTPATTRWHSRRRRRCLSAPPGARTSICPLACIPMLHMPPGRPS